MLLKKINLDELFNNNFDCYTDFDNEGICNETPSMSKEKFKEVVLIFSKQLLELVVENAEITTCYLKGFDSKEFEINIVNKETILDTIKQVE